jgi:hypothetical protein
VVALLATEASRLSLFGAFGFGVVIGWFLYFVNRYRSGEVGLGDVATLVAAIGGGAVLALFPAGSDLFGAYGVGLAVGFFGYLVVLACLVWRSDSFGLNWFLDGRRKPPVEPEVIPPGTRETVAAMSDPGAGSHVK